MSLSLIFAASSSPSAPLTSSRKMSSSGIPPPRRLWIQFNTNNVQVLGYHLTEALADGTMRVDEFSEEALAFLGRK